MKRKIQEKNKGKIEARFAKIKCSNVNKKLNNMEQYRWNIEEWIFGNFIS